jgi:hypothetical protein
MGVGLASVPWANVCPSVMALKQGVMYGSIQTTGETALEDLDLARELILQHVGKAGEGIDDHGLADCH